MKRCVDDSKLQTSAVFSLLLLSSYTQFWVVYFMPKYFHFLNRLAAVTKKLTYERTLLVLPSPNSRAHSSSLRLFQRIRPSPMPCVTFRNKLFCFQLGLVNHPVQPPSWRTTLCWLSRLLIQCIRSSPPYLEAIPICSLRTHCALLSGAALFNVCYQDDQTVEDKIGGTCCLYEDEK
jgi:hypothetical protein